MSKQRKGVVTHEGEQGSETTTRKRKPREANPLTKAASAVAATARERKRYADQVEGLRNRLGLAENHLDVAVQNYENAKRQLNELAGE